MILACVCTSVESSGHTFSSPLGFGRGIFENSPLLSLNNMILYALSRWRPTQLGEGKKIKFTRYHIIKMCMNIMPLSDQSQLLPRYPAPIYTLLNDRQLFHAHTFLYAPSRLPNKRGTEIYGDTLESGHTGKGKGEAQNPMGVCWRTSHHDQQHQKAE